METEFSITEIETLLTKMKEHNRPVTLNWTRRTLRVLGTPAPVREDAGRAARLNVLYECDRQIL